MPDDVTLVLDFKFSRTAKVERNIGERVVAVAAQSVGFKAAKNRQRKLIANLQRDFVPVVERELQDMARKVATMGVGMGNTRNPPPGSLSIDGRISTAMTGNSGPMTIASVTGMWKTRSKAYMKYKFRRYGTRKWFLNSGNLQRQLGSVGTYRAAYGGMSVRFIPTTLGSAAVVSSLGRSSGGQSPNITIGRLEVTPMKRLQLSDLPAIGQQAGYKPSLLSPLADSVERKLKGHPTKGYRPVIEPFLSYYMNRKIPNAVYRKLEDSLLS